MRKCVLNDFLDKNITNFNEVEQTWFNRLCPANQVDDPLFKVRNSKHNRTERNSFQIEITEC